MNPINLVKGKVQRAYYQLRKRNDFHILLAIISFLCSFSGFPLHKKKISVFAPFWILHISLLIYVYLIGNIDFELNRAVTAMDYVKSFTNVALLIHIANNSFWWLKEWSSLGAVIEIMKLSDKLATNPPTFIMKYENYMRRIKNFILFYYFYQYSCMLFVYMPQRSNINHDFCMTPCVGMESLDQFPNHHICRVILGLQELTILQVTDNWQALLIVLVDHTVAMYRLLAEDLMTLNNSEIDNTSAEEKLEAVVQRHVLILDTINRLKSLYSMPIGANFFCSAVCVALFFFLSLEQVGAFVPILIYCFLAFFVYCFLGQRLANAAERFERAVYACGWEKFDKKIQKHIFIMLLQSQTKVELLAADIVPINIYTFATTLQFLYKFITMVKVNI